MPESAGSWSSSSTTSRGVTSSGVIPTIDPSHPRPPGARPTDRLRRIVETLCTPSAFDHPVRGFEIIETHISYVLLTGPFAYKFKKPLSLGFLDYRGLEKRRFYCEEELRLNRRLAPSLYLAVRPVTGSVARPRLGGSGRAIEYCVAMVQFPREQALDRLIERGDLTEDHIDQLGAEIARFHAEAPAAGDDTSYGTAALVHRYALENFAHIGQGPPGRDTGGELEALRASTSEMLARHGALFEARRAAGRVRECHGDLHLSNLVLLDGRVVVFDCIEFNPELIWIDVVSEIAFLAMDLDVRRRPDFSARFLNRYLEASGDYAGVALLDFYRLYRSLVRAKVAHLTARDAEGEARAAALARYLGHIRLARGYTGPRRPAILVITHGLSGSGKSWLSDRIAARTGAIRVRSDLERKRLAGLEPLERTASPVRGGLYSPAHSERTYAHLLGLARLITAAGHPVIVDASFLRYRERAAFGALAQRLGLPFRILAVDAPDETLRERIGRRLAAGADASEADVAVLDHQRRTREPLRAEERALAVTLVTGAEPDLIETARRLGLVPNRAAGQDATETDPHRAGYDAPSR